MDAASYVSDRIGLPYSATDLHCWELTRLTQWDLFSRLTPVVAIEEGGDHHMLILARQFAQNPARKLWEPVGAPEHGAIALMSRPGRLTAIHCGTFLDLDGGGVFHTDHDHGVAFDGLLEIAIRNWNVEWFIPR